MSSQWVLLILGIVTLAALWNDLMACELSSTDCLARNIYFESRNESLLGKIAVGLVVLNRTRDRRWSSDICEVVYEGWQFSWTQDDLINIPSNMKAFRDTWYIAAALLSDDSEIIDFTQGSTHYHAKEILPKWSTQYKRVIQIGNHIFYR